MRRIVIHRNGSSIDGKLLLVRQSMEELLTAASQKLGVHVTRLYTHHGGLVDDISLIRDDDVLFASTGDDFIPPKLGGPKVTSGQTGQQDWVSLNVGGKVFTTTRSTLIALEPDSMLAKMFCGTPGCLAPGTRDASGAYLIDRSYTYFEPILNYLRTGSLIIDKNINPEGILEEAKFYGLQYLIWKLEALIADTKRKENEEERLCRKDVISALLTTKPSQELRFQGVNLKGADLSMLDLRNINFKYADLSECHLYKANLSGCNLERANLQGANLEGAQLINVHLLCANLERANLRKCNFEDPAGNRANCEGVNLCSAVMEGSTMAGVDLRVAALKNANLKNCDLRAAVLAGADMKNCDLTGSDLQQANLRGANLEDATFDSIQTPLHMSQTCSL